MQRFNPHLFLIRDEMYDVCVLLYDITGFNPHLFLIRDEMHHSD